MERLANYKLNYDSRWLTLGGVLFGVAFFLQALDFLWFRGLQGVSFWQILLFMILPMVMEAVWCTCTRVIRKQMTPAFGVFGAVFCLNLCMQALFYGSSFVTVISILIYLLCGAAMVLISWGFVPHRALGLLVFGAAGIIRILCLDIIQWFSQKNWTALSYHLPSVCILFGLMLYFAAIHAENDGAAQIEDAQIQEDVPASEDAITAAEIAAREPTVKIDAGTVATLLEEMQEMERVQADGEMITEQPE